MNILHYSPITLARAGFTALLSKYNDRYLVHSAEDKEDVVILLNRYQVDILVIEILPQNDLSTSIIDMIKSQSPITPCLGILPDHDSINLDEVKIMGLHGCITQSCSEDEILDAISSVHKGERFFCNKLLEKLLTTSNPREDDCSATTLSDREVQIVTLVASGLTNKKIANQLNISPHTVHTHRKNIMRKLNVSNASELTVYAVKMGLLSVAQ